MSQAEAYLFTGPENGDKNEAITNIREAARKKHSDIDEYSYFAADIKISDLVAQLQNESLFSSALFILVRNAEQIKLKADIDLLASWIKSAGDSANTLILTSDETYVEKKLESLFATDHKKVFWEMFDNRKPQWLKDFFRKNGYSVTDEAVDQILEMIENNTEALKSECSRFFFCFDKGHTISTDDVDKILSHNREENAFTLFEAMADKARSPKQRLETSLEILQKIRLSKDSNPTALISGLSYCFRQLRFWHTINGKGMKATDAQLKAAGFAGKTNQARYKKAAQVWGSGATASILSLLAGTDLATRESGNALSDSQLTLMIYSIVIKNGVYCSTYEEN